MPPAPLLSRVENDGGARQKMAEDLSQKINELQKTRPESDRLLSWRVRGCLQMAVGPFHSRAAPHIGLTICKKQTFGDSKSLWIVKQLVRKIGNLLQRS